MLKRLFLPFVFFFLVCCDGSLPQNVEVSTSPISTPTLTEFERIKKDKYLEEVKKDTEKSIKEESKLFSLSNLHKEEFLFKDIEMRLWKFSAFGERDVVFILSKKKEVWSAKIVQRIIDQKNIDSNIPNKIRSAKYFQTKLENPKSGWDRLLQKLIDSKILILPDGSEVDVDPVPDGWSFVIETKVNNNYRVYTYFGPEVFEEIKEAKQMVKIISIISEEFKLDDFDSNNFMLP